MQSFHLLTDFGVIQWMSSRFYANKLSVRYLSLDKFTNIRYNADNAILRN